MKVLRPLLIGLALLCPALGLAQNFPTKTIRLIVPFPPGGPNDIIARVVGQQHVGDPQADDRHRQSRRAGRRARHRRRREGRSPTATPSRIASAGALAISPSMEKVAYDTLKDLQPVTLVAKVPEMLVVATSVPAKNMNELVALAKSQPGKLNFASSGPGSLPHLAGELFKLTAKIDIVHVPYRGAAPAVNDLLGQQVQMVFLDLPVLLPQIKAGKLKPIAVGAPQARAERARRADHRRSRHARLQTENWYGMVAPAKTPPAVVAALNKAAVEAMKDPDVVTSCRARARSWSAIRPDHFRAYHRQRNQEMGEGDQGRRRPDARNKR